MAAAGGFCLACRQMTMTNDQRILCSEASSNVPKPWMDLHAERLKDMDMDIDDVESVFGDATPTCTCTHVCRKCFKSIEAFHERKKQLLSKLDTVIENIPNTSRTVSGLTESSAAPPPPHLGSYVTSRERSCYRPYPEQK